MIPPSAIARVATLDLSAEQAEAVALLLADVERATMAEFIGPFAAVRWRDPSAQAEHWLKALWDAYVEASEKAQASRAFSDAMAARERYRVFLLASAPLPPEASGKPADGVAA